jgi:FkbM family methyltransferase
VLAFEPEPENVGWIRKSIELNEYRNISLMQYALADEDASVPLYLGDKSGWHTLLPNRPARGRGVIEVQQRRLDSVLAESGNPAIDVMKIDVEGGELGVMRGARRCLSDHRVATLFIDVHPHLGVDPFEVRDELQSHGYRVTALTPGGEPDSGVRAETAEMIASVVPG